MESSPSDRPRPWVLRVRQRKWWKRSSIWFLVLLFAVVMAAAFLAFTHFLRLQDEEDSEGRVPRACLRERAG
jgi:hypothetical protein